MQNTGIITGDVIGCYRGVLYEIPKYTKVPVVDDRSGQYWILWEDHTVPVLQNCLKVDYQEV